MKHLFFFFKIILACCLVVFIGSELMKFNDNDMTAYLIFKDKKQEIDIAKPIPMMHSDGVNGASSLLLFSENGLKQNASIKFYVDKFNLSSNTQIHSIVCKDLDISSEECQNRLKRTFNGVVLQIIADGKEIAKMTEDPYSKLDCPFIEDKKYCSVDFNFAIPERVKEIEVRVLDNGSQGWDHVRIEKLSVFSKIESKKIVLVILSSILFLYLLWSICYTIASLRGGKKNKNFS